MITYDFDKLNSLKYRVLGGIFLIFFLAIGMVLYGVLTYQRDKIIYMNSHNSMQIGLTIVAGLSSSMLQNDREESKKIIETMIGTTHLSRISVLNKEGKIVMTSEPSLAGMVLDKSTDATCLVCHKNSATQRSSTAIIENGDKPYIRTTIAIENKAACHGCHAKEKKIVGILFVDSSLDATNALLRDMTLRILLTAISIFLLGAFLINFIVTRFLTKPLEALEAGFEKVGRGQFDYWVNVTCGGEISHMADSFNIMSRAIHRYIDEVKVKSNEVSTLYSIVQEINLTIEKKKLTTIVVDLLYDILEVECVTLALPIENGPKNTFQIISRAIDDKRHYRCQFDIESVAQLRCSLTREDLSHWEAHKLTSLAFSADGSKLLLPLQLKDMKVALICATKPAGEYFTRTQRKIIPVLAHHMTISFANAQLYHLAVTDELTALYTKRYFHQEMVGFEKEYRVNKKGFCVMMLDLDHFKKVNDTYGHPVGDLVLTQIGALIMANTRHGDIACRYGGEEFVVLLKDGDPNECSTIAERIRTAVEKHSFTIDDIPPFRKTVSIGLACCPQHFCTDNKIVAAADSALYKAKNSGRNQVVMYTSEED